MVPQRCAVTAAWRGAGLVTAAACERQQQCLTESSTANWREPAFGGSVWQAADAIQPL